MADLIAHIGGVPVEEALIAAPAALAAGGVCLALLRARWSTRTGLRRAPRS